MKVENKCKTSLEVGIKWRYSLCCPRRREMLNTLAYLIPK